MARYVFKLPDVGEGTAEAEIVAWHVAVGQTIAEDDPLVDVMTDKATVEMTSPVSGTVLELTGAPGDLAPVGSGIVVIDTLDEATSGSDLTSDPSPAPPAEGDVAADGGSPVDDSHQIAAVNRPSDPALEPGAPQTPPHETAALGTTRVLAPPAVRRRADDLGVDLAAISGTGPQGRVEHADLDAHLCANAPAASAGYARRDGVEEVKVIGLRRKIAEKMQDAKRRIPHFAYVEEVDMTALEELRVHLNSIHSGRGKLTVLPFFMRALVKALPGYPQINARFDDDAGVVRRHAGVHIGIATQTPSGLVVPVVRHAETLDLWAAAAAVARLAEAARTGKAAAEDLSGSTITLTSLGPLGGVVTTPVINHPEVAIVGPNKIIERPVVRQGHVVVRKMMNLSSSFDHRVVDGYDAAAFIQQVKALLENPATLFMA
jgi:2-oxoisovalerate dehydrogenase E2 component (dihydrolipoyl transacylase)